MWLCSGPRICLVTETTSHDIPYGDAFVVVELWDVRPDAGAVLSSTSAGANGGGSGAADGSQASLPASPASEPHGCRLRVSSKVVWSRSRPFVAGIVESKSREAVQETHAEWLSMAQDHAASHTQSMLQGGRARSMRTPSTQQSPVPPLSPNAGGGAGSAAQGIDASPTPPAPSPGRRRDHRSASSSHHRHRRAEASHRNGGGESPGSQGRTDHRSSHGRARAASTTALRAVDAAGLVAPVGVDEGGRGRDSAGARRRRRSREAPQDSSHSAGAAAAVADAAVRRLVATRRAVERAVRPEDGPVLGPAQLAARPPAELTAQYHRLHGAYTRAVDDAAAARVVAAAASRGEGPTTGRGAGRSQEAARLQFIRRAITIAVCAALLALCVAYWSLAARVAALEENSGERCAPPPPLSAADPLPRPPPATGPVDDSIPL